MPRLTEHQVALRRSRIGASEVGALLGPHPYTTPARIYARIVDGPEPEKSTAAMRAGHGLEAAIAHYAAADLGLRIRACSLTYTHDVLPLAASPDYYIVGPLTGSHDHGILEVKLSRDWTDWLDGPPPWYAWQVRAQLALTGRPYGILAALVGTSVQVHRIDRDAAKERELMAAVAAFAMYHLGPKSPPATEDERLVLRWGLEAGETIASGDLEQLGDQYAMQVRSRRKTETWEANARAAFVARLVPGTRLVLGNGWSAKVDDRGTLRFDVRKRPDE